MTSTDIIMDADSTSASPPPDFRLEYETSASDHITKTRMKQQKDRDASKQETELMENAPSRWLSTSSVSWHFLSEYIEQQQKKPYTWQAPLWGHIAGPIEDQFEELDTLSNMEIAFHKSSEFRNNILLRYFSAGSDISSPSNLRPYYVELSDTLSSDNLLSFISPIFSSCYAQGIHPTHRKNKKPEALHELDIEKDVRLWTPPKKVIPMRIRFRIKNRESESE